MLSQNFHVSQIGFWYGVALSNGFGPESVGNLTCSFSRMQSSNAEEHSV